MLNAEEAKKQTQVDLERADFIEKGICSQIERAASKGEHKVEGWVYDRYEHRWLGDIPDAVIEELEQRFEYAGYKLEWESIAFAGCVARIIRW